VVVGVPIEWYILKVVILEESGYLFPLLIPWIEAAVIAVAALLTATLAGLGPGLPAVRQRIPEATAYGGVMSDLPELKELADRLREHVRTLAATPRVPRTPEHHQAAIYVREHLRQAGFVVPEDGRPAGTASCRNVAAEPRPADAQLPLVVVGAHYASAAGSPGADDNASAVAALLELARWIGPQLQAPGPWHARLQLIAYDLEEYGLVGSWNHSQEIERSGLALRG